MPKVNSSYRRNSRAIKLIISSGTSLILVGTFAFLRIPILLDSTSTSVVAALFFYFGIMAWYPFFVAADVNLSRISTVNSGRPKILSSNFKLKKHITIPFSLIGGASLYHLLNDYLMLRLILIGLPSFLMFYLLNKRLAWAFGFAQGRGMQIFLSAQSTFGAFFSFLSIFLITKFSFWQDLVPQLQFQVLFLATLLGNSVPMIAARISASRTRIQPLDEPIGYRKKWMETLSTFPPAIITGFDTIALLFFANEKDLISYGIYSRLILLVALIPSALQIEIVNGSNRLPIDGSQFLKSLLLSILNIPAILFVALFHAEVIDFLSNSVVEVNKLVIILVCAYGFILFPWVVLNSRMLAVDTARIWFGKKVFQVILPLTLISVSLFTSLFGYTGTFLSLNFVYAVACFYCIRALRHSRSKGR
jgi:hypothetical protein